MASNRNCRNHPERPGTVYCQKYDRFYCDECIQCREPMQYCKFRTACLIWEFEKHGLPDDREERSPTEKATETGPEEASEKATVSK